MFRPLDLETLRPVTSALAAAGPLAEIGAALSARIAGFELEGGAVLVQVPQVPLELIEPDVARSRGYFAYPPHSLFYLAATFRGLGIETRLLDLNFVTLDAAQRGKESVVPAWRAALDAALGAFERPLVCVSLMFDNTYAEFARVCRHVRESLPHAVILAGGVAASADPEKILDDDHYGLKKAKERILEYLAVQHLVKALKGPILCFVGPPGVGKTSLGRSIARALGRKFVRISLGGVRDESEIRGHRRTYVGALPGRIIQGLRKAGSNNPVFMLDEIDKLGADFRGDPAAALLEVLDPQQNDTFSDHYLDVDFDLSKVMFITTANLLTTVPGPLRDRMEEIPISGYTPDEKVQIARRHLLPRQLDEHGIGEDQLRLTDEALEHLIADYTREAGLRNLERALGGLSRKVARKFVEGRKRRIEIGTKEVGTLLGAAPFFHEVAGREPAVGMVTGLAATAAGGEILFIEATRMPGRKNLILTGQLGEVMQESARAALSYLRSQAEVLKIDPAVFDESDIHLHVPAGATPKEGPSAGIALAAALISLFTGRVVDSQIAMTGELTLRGRVLPVGGIRDKILAAHQAGIRTVVLPKKNKVDLEDVPATIRRRLRFVLVDHIEEVFKAVLGAKARRQTKTQRAKTKKSPAQKAVAVKKKAAAKTKKSPAQKAVAVKKKVASRAAKKRPLGKKNRQGAKR